MAPSLESRTWMWYGLVLESNAAKLKISRNFHVTWIDFFYFHPQQKLWLQLSFEREEWIKQLSLMCFKEAMTLAWGNVLCLFYLFQIMSWKLTSIRHLHKIFIFWMSCGCIMSFIIWIQVNVSFSGPLNCLCNSFTCTIPPS